MSTIYWHILIEKNRIKFNKDTLNWKVKIKDTRLVDNQGFSSPEIWIHILLQWNIIQDIYRESHKAYLHIVKRINIVSTNS